MTSREKQQNGLAFLGAGLATFIFAQVYYAAVDMDGDRLFWSGGSAVVVGIAAALKHQSGLK